jgi:hypothetical protein
MYPGACRRRAEGRAAGLRFRPAASLSELISTVTVPSSFLFTA